MPTLSARQLVHGRTLVAVGEPLLAILERFHINHGLYLAAGQLAQTPAEKVTLIGRLQLELRDRAEKREKGEKLPDPYANAPRNAPQHVELAHLQELLAVAPGFNLHELHADCRFERGNIWWLHQMANSAALFQRWQDEYRALRYVCGGAPRRYYLVNEGVTAFVFGALFREDAYPAGFFILLTGFFWLLYVGLTRGGWDAAVTLVGAVACLVGAVFFWMLLDSLLQAQIKAKKQQAAHLLPPTQLTWWWPLPKLGVMYSELTREVLKWCGRAAGVAVLVLGFWTVYSLATQTTLRERSAPAGARRADPPRLERSR